MNRNFAPAAPDRLWVADLTYVSTWLGWVYVAYVVDAYARRILGWRCGSSMSTQLVLDALEQAVWTRQRSGAPLDLVVAHTGRGSQDVSIRCTERLAEAGIAASDGSVGDSFDNALAETINGLYDLRACGCRTTSATELIKPRGPWRTPDAIEFASAEWVDWSTTAASTSTAATSHPPKPRSTTTLNNQPSRPLSSHTPKSPGSPRRLGLSAACEEVRCGQLLPSLGTGLGMRRLYQRCPPRGLVQHRALLCGGRPHLLDAPFLGGVHHLDHAPYGRCGASVSGSADA